MEPGALVAGHSADVGLQRIPELAEQPSQIRASKLGYDSYATMSRDIVPDRVCSGASLNGVIMFTFLHDVLLTCLV